eukprot:TRINITY_DN40825_c0_g1_i1.p1 TRINITY_DN40825_c0_g1~~TRINITY_DN40825_c0_g1_i1.p1  ORF type:complete len:430 (-),score=27.54 TRINITY_DN40825_c0_g1_i1:123-1412(-)
MKVSDYRLCQLLEPLHVLYLSVFLDLFSVGLVVPLLPHIAKEIGVSPSVYGLVGTCYGLTQIVGDPVMGYVSDKHGRRVVLLISLAGSALAYFLVGIAGSLALLLISRLMVGLVKQTTTVASALISDLTTSSSRAVALGRLGTMIGGGFIVGPTLGGFISQEYGIRAPAFLAVLIFLLDFLLVWSCIHTPPVVVSEEVKKERQSDIDECSCHSIGFLKALCVIKKGLARMAGRPIVVVVLVFRLFQAMDEVLVGSSYLLFLQYQYNVTPKETGLITSFQALIAVFAKAFLIGIARKHYPEHALVKIMSGLLSVSYLILALSNSLNAYLAMCVFTLSFASILDVAITSSFTQLFKKEEIGAALGLYGWIASLCRVVMPSIAGYLIEYKPSAPYFLSALLQLCLFFFTVSLRFFPGVLPRSGSFEVEAKRL